MNQEKFGEMVKDYNPPTARQGKAYILKIIKDDIHNRVNWAVTAGKLGIDKQKKRIILSLKIDTNFVPVMEYFEIFTDRMVYCRKAAKYLGYQFGLVINNFKLL